MRLFASLKDLTRPVLIIVFTLMFSMKSFGMEAGRQVSLATLDWEPYIGQGIPGHGYVYEVVVEAFKQSGIDVGIKFYPWQRSLMIARSGQADGLFPEYYDKGRIGDFAFSDPMPGGPVGFYIRKDSSIRFPVDPRKNPAKAFQGMKQYSFGVVQGYINTREFDRSDFLRKEIANSDEELIKMLHAKRVNIIFIDKFVAEHIISTKYPHFASDLMFMEPALEYKSLYIAFSRKAPSYMNKMKAFNRGLNAINKNGRLRSIIKKHGFRN